MRCSRTFIETALLAVVCACSEPRSARPDVILVVLDTLRADHLSHYGYELPTAAPLDGFAETATRFERCHSPAPWTLPSAASLFTGFFTARHGVNTKGAKVADEVLMLPEVLRRNGWSTGAFSCNPYVSEELGFAQGFDRFEGFGGKATAYPDIAEMVAQAEQWLDGATQPLFLYLHAMNVHGPYKVPEERRDDLLGRPPDGEFRYYDERMRGIMAEGLLEWREQVDPDYLRSLTEQYDTAIHYSMEVLSGFFDDLRRRGKFDGSLIVVTSDHGEELFDHGGFSHGYSLHEELLHVPLYVKLPYQTDGAVVADSVSLLDVFPTIVDVLGLDVETSLDGRSLASYLNTPPTRTSRASHRLHQVAWAKRCTARAIVQDGYKLIAIDSNYEGREDEQWLFELESDPDETEDLTGTRPEVAARLGRILDERFDAYRELALDEPEIVLDQLDAQRLEALGYGGNDE